jgi:hypothetical protein
MTHPHHCHKPLLVGWLGGSKTIHSRQQYPQLPPRATAHRVEMGSNDGPGTGRMIQPPPVATESSGHSSSNEAPPPWADEGLTMTMRPPQQREGEGSVDDDNTTAGRAGPTGWQRGQGGHDRTMMMIGLMMPASQPLPPHFAWGWGFSLIVYNY